MSELTHFNESEEAALFEAMKAGEPMVCSRCEERVHPERGPGRMGNAEVWVFVCTGCRCRGGYVVGNR